MAEDAAQRTEPATPQRRQDARKKGRVAQSRELQSVAVLGAALFALSTPLGAKLAASMLLGMRHAFAAAADPPASLVDYKSFLFGGLLPSALALAPILALLAVTGALVQLVQTGPLWSAQILAPRWDRIDPAQGVKRLFDPDRLFDLLKSLLKLGIVAAVMWWVLHGSVPELISLSRADLASGLQMAGRVCFQLAAALLALFAVLAPLDLLYQRMRYEQRLRMTRRELRDELRQREGDPLQRSRARSLHRDLSRSRMIAAVADADVVVTNPTHFAVALRYQAEQAAPVVVAKGRNKVAERIREAAREHDVPIVENPPLARLLARSVEVGREIPENLFQAVAEVLAFVHRLRPQRSRGWGIGS
ncbi:MAG: flagellar biosynthesis protein FlhB [Myxococcales bacterium]|nr:flagellar biosynthesis protein FlhB [Myxococcales bacterium]